MATNSNKWTINWIVYYSEAFERYYNLFKKSTGISWYRIKERRKETFKKASDSKSIIVDDYPRDLRYWKIK